VKPEENLTFVALSNEKLPEILNGCSRGESVSQKTLYQHYYGYAMSITLRYAQDNAEAQEIMNDGFLKIFQKIDNFDRNKSFQMWLRRIMINTAIDYYRKRNPYTQPLDVVEATHKSHDADVLDDISEKEILQLVQKLPPSYKLIFNLYVIEGYKHEEIAQELGIHVGTSKSNLAKARKHLQRMIQELNEVGIK
jgi:RNA polymerase sigma factor (sigma-70 family)